MSKCCKKDGESKVDVGYPVNDKAPFAVPHKPRPTPVYKRPDNITDYEAGVEGLKGYDLDA